MWGYMKNLRLFLSNEDGNFAIMFSVVSAVLAIGVAAAIDISGMHKSQAELQNHLDSAALAAVIEIARNDENYNSEGQGNTPRNQAYKDVVIKVLETHGVDLKGAVPDVVVRDNQLMVNATIPYDLQFGGVLNKPSTDISAISEVVLPGGGAAVEIALVLDNTESMNFDGKMTALKNGVRDFIEAIEETDSGSKIALVPFARYVDVGEDKRNEPWLNVPVEFDTDRTWQQATHTGGTCTIENRTRFEDGVEVTYEANICTGQTTTYEEMTQVVESRWIGCVGVRANGLHMEDGSYGISTSKIPGLLHKNPYEATGLGWDLESWCPHTITPLTDDYDMLNSQVGHLYGTDRTYIPIGLNWGRRILSPQVPFSEADTVDPKRQIMILMSDGQNTAYLDDSIDGFETIPYIEDLSTSQQQSEDVPPGTDADTAALCEVIKAEGTEVYTIAFKVENAVTRSLLMSCASSPQNYFDAGTNTSLVESFKNISENLETEIRLVR